MNYVYSHFTYAESWIEVASRPSSSSLSSSTTDEATSAARRQAQEHQARRRRRLQQQRSLTANSEPLARFRPRSAAGSSQEEYEESESDSDRLLTSSNEDLAPPHDGNGRGGDPQLAQSDDESATALGVADPAPVFTPQPNAFSHPPAAAAAAAQRPLAAPDSYFPSSAPSSRTALASRNSTTATARPRAHGPANLLAPGPAAGVDHDAALRASLSTLLSCAAAARGRPKPEAASSANPSPPRAPALAPADRVAPGALRLVPGSALDAAPPPPALPPRPRSPRAPSSGSRGRAGGAAAKRRSKSPSRERRKKRRAAAASGWGHEGVGGEVAAVSPTLTTWVVGAGVLVLFSAITFSAGYAMGYEVGRAEALTGGAATAGGLGGLGGGAMGCGREAVRGRSWRWGNASGVRV